MPLGRGLSWVPSAAIYDGILPAVIIDGPVFRKH